ncbi:MAG: tetratricopeptide repeat protein [Bacteroidota bacterium]
MFQPMWNRIFLFTFLLTLLAAHSIAQNYQHLLDSVKNSKDTTRVNALIDLGRYLRRINLDSAVLFLDQASSEAAEIKYTKGQIKALMSKGIGYGMNNLYTESILTFNQIIQIATENNDYSSLSSAYNNLGIVYKRIGDYPTSYDYYNKCLEIELLDSANLDLSFAYTNLGILHDLMKEHEKSYEFYLKALEIAERKGRETNSILSNIAIYFMWKEDYDESIRILRNLHYTTDDRYVFFNTASNLARIYNKIHKYDSAIHFSNIVIDSAFYFGGEDLVVTTRYNRADAYLAKSKINEALEDAKQAVEESKQFGFQLQHDSYGLLARVYEQMGNYQEETKALKQVIALQDSLFETDKVQSFKAEEVKQDIFEKNRQIEKQQSDLEQLEIKSDRDKFLKLFLASLAGALVILIGFLFQRYNLKNQLNIMLEKKNQVISDQKNKIEDINEQLESRMLRAQINPHFIFNALNSIQHFIAQNDRKTALSYLTKFSSLLRQILENSINVMVSIEDELKSLEIYLEIESLRFDGAFKYQIIVDPKVDIHGHEVPILLLQPFAENAILHGLMPKKGDKSLKVLINQADDFIIYQIEDNGIGRKEARERKSHHTQNKSRGMSVTSQRIALLKSKSQAAEVIIEDNKPSGTIVTIKIPIN